MNTNGLREKQTKVRKQEENSRTTVEAIFVVF